MHYFYGLIVNHHSWIYLGCTSRGISAGFTIFSVLQVRATRGGGEKLAIDACTVNSVNSYMGQRELACNWERGSLIKVN